MTTNNSFNARATGGGEYVPNSTVTSGNPNGSVAGTLGDIYFDSVGLVGYTCTATGSTSTAVWAADSSTSSALVWVNTTGATQAMSANTGYIANNGSGVTAFTLPTTIAVGQRLSIAGGLSTSWSLAQNASQLIHFGSVVTTTGTGGSISSTNEYDQLDLICIVANTTFAVRGCLGNLTYV
jgi:hypothetical protein